jgi:hypothetical protein
MNKQYLMTPPPTNNKVKEDQSASPVKPGQYVFVAQDLSPGKFSHGGEAWVKAAHGTGGSIVCDERQPYIQDQIIEAI